MRIKYFPSHGTFLCLYRICNNYIFTSSLPPPGPQTLPPGEAASVVLPKCGLLSIGETKCRLGDYFTKQFHIVHKAHRDFAAAYHLNDPSHSDIWTVTLFQ